MIYIFYLGRNGIFFSYAEKYYYSTVVEEECFENIYSEDALADFPSSTRLIFKTQYLRNELTYKTGQGRNIWDDRPR